jgi:hypothetical protein
MAAGGVPTEHHTARSEPAQRTALPPARAVCDPPASPPSRPAARPVVPAPPACCTTTQVQPRSRYIRARVVGALGGHSSSVGACATHSTYAQTPSRPHQHGATPPPPPAPGHTPSQGYPGRLTRALTDDRCCCPMHLPSHLPSSTLCAPCHGAGSPSWPEASVIGAVRSATSMVGSLRAGSRPVRASAATSTAAAGLCGSTHSCEHERHPVGISR